jgi:RNA polymerase sigma-70 factor (ECF subfamily)
MALFQSWQRAQITVPPATVKKSVRLDVTFPSRRDIVSVSHGSTNIQKLHCQDDGDAIETTLLVTFSSRQDTFSVRTRSITFHELYSRYANDVYRFAHWLTGNPNDAQDITSETFIRAWTAPEEPRMDSVKAYLFAIARNLHRKQWRRTSRLQELDEEMSAPETAPDMAAEQKDEFQRTLAALQALPEIDRTVLLLRAEEELSYEDISATTGLSVTAAKVRVFRARAKLAALLQTEKG